MKSLFEEYGKTALTVLCALVFLTIIGTVGVIKPWEKPPKVVDKITFEVTNGQATYNGSPQTGNAKVKVTNPTTNYSVVYEETMSERQTAFTNAGTYVVKFRVEAKGFETVRGSYTLTIDKAVPSYTHPTLATGLKYNATEQRLIKASPSGISNLYSVGNNKNYSAKVPTGLNAGKYKIYWKAEETTNYLAYEAYLGEAVIDKGDWNVKVNKTNNDIRYTAGKETTLNFPNTYSLDTREAINKGGVLEYKLSTASLWSTDIPTAKEIGNYLVNVRVSGDSNHNEFTSSYTAILKGGNYTLSFDAKGGSALSNKTVTYGSGKGTSVGVSSRTGYNFLGWYTNSGEPVFDSNGYAIQYKKHDTYWKGGSNYDSSWMGGSYTDWNNMAWNYPNNLNLQAKWEQIMCQVDVIPSVNETPKESGYSGFTFDVYLNGSKYKSNVTTFNEKVAYGTYVKIVITSKTDGSYDYGGWEGTVTSGVTVRPWWNYRPYLDLNYWIDGTQRWTSVSGFTVDIYANNSVIARNVGDYGGRVPYGADIRVEVNTMPRAYTYERWTKKVYEDASLEPTFMANPQSVWISGTPKAGTTLYCNTDPSNSSFKYFWYKRTEGHDSNWQSVSDKNYYTVSDWDADNKQQFYCSVGNAYGYNVKGSGWTKTTEPKLVYKEESKQDTGGDSFQYRDRVSLTWAFSEPVQVVGAYCEVWNSSIEEEYENAYIYLDGVEVSSGGPGMNVAGASWSGSKWVSKIELVGRSTVNKKNIKGTVKFYGKP